MSRVIGDIVERALAGEGRAVAEKAVAGAVKASPTVENLLAWEGVSGAWRPTNDWFSTVQKKLNGFFGMAEGNVPKIDVEGAYKKVDDALLQSGLARDRLTATLRPILKGLDDDKLTAYGEILGYPQEHWAKAADQFGLDAKDLQRVSALKDWDAQLQQETGGVSLVEGMGKLQQARTAAPEGDDLWARSISKGYLNPNDANVGRAITEALNKGLYDKHLADPVVEFQKVMDTPGAQSKYLLDPIRWRMQNYVNLVEGVPDKSQRILTNFANAVGDKVTEISPTIAHYTGFDKGGKALLQKVTTMAAAAGLGARPALIVRDLFEMHRPLAVMGVNFMKGLARAITPEGWDQAEVVALRGKNISEMLGDIDQSIFKDTPTKVAEKLLAPTRWGNNIGRKAAYLGEYDRALQRISEFRSGSLSPEELINSTGLFFHDEAPRARLLSMALDHSIPVPTVADAFGRQMVDSTLFSMRYGNAGALFATGAGRILGQYGQWPMNFFEFTKRLVRTVRDNPRKGAPVLAAWVAMNAAMQEAAKGVGVDVRNWTFLAPGAYTGSPYKEFIENIAAAPDASPTGEQARRRLIEFPLTTLMPGGVQIQNLLRAAEEPGGFSSNDGMLRLMGFKPLAKEEDLSLDEWLRKEAGYGTGRTR